MMKRHSEQTTINSIPWPSRLGDWVPGARRIGNQLLSPFAGMLLLACSQLVGAEPIGLIYQANFENGAGPQWSVNHTEATPVGNRRFLGQFGNETVTLTLTNPPPEKRLSRARGNNNLPRAAP
jgi:hypothetical protein